MAKLPACPVCGEKMENGFVYVSGSRGANICWLREKPTFWHVPKNRTTLLKFNLSSSIDESVAEAYRCLKCNMILFSYRDEPRFSEEKLAGKSKETYTKLLNYYTSFRSNPRQFLENKLKNLSKKGLSLEEAIKELAIKEKIIEE